MGNECVAGSPTLVLDLIFYTVVLLSVVAISLALLYGTFIPHWKRRNPELFDNEGESDAEG